jgi:hypothetical protein
MPARTNKAVSTSSSQQEREREQMFSFHFIVLEIGDEDENYYMKTGNMRQISTFLLH